jgi:hypothetical protein
MSITRLVSRFMSLWSEPFWLVGKPVVLEICTGCELRRCVCSQHAMTQVVR